MSRASIAAAAATLALTASAGASRASAQVVPSHYRSIEHGQEAGPAGGTMSFRPGSLDLGPQLEWFAGARYAIEASGPLFFEGLAGYAPGTRQVVDPRRQEGDRTIGDAEVRMLMASARLGFSLTGRRTWRGLSPFLFAAVGVASDIAESGELDETLDEADRFSFGTAFTASSGTGLRVALGSRLMLRLDGELLFWRISTPAGFHEEGKFENDVEDREWVYGYGLSAGISLRF